MATNQIDNSEEIILGSGDTYICKFTGEIPTDEEIETDENRAGNTKGGASLAYSITSQSVKDDKGRVSKTIITAEDVKFKTGMITWCKNYIQALISTARVDETSKPGHRVFKIGGLSKQSKDRWLFRFVHTRGDGRKMRVTVTGKNTGGINMDFNPDNPTTIDAEISAESLDNEGTLVIIDDEQPKDTTQQTAAQNA